jgi:hypothetical protein
MTTAAPQATHLESMRWLTPFKPAERSSLEKNDNTDLAPIPLTATEETPHVNNTVQFLASVLKGNLLSRALQIAGRTNAAEPCRLPRHLMCD